MNIFVIFEFLMIVDNGKNIYILLLFLIPLLAEYI